MPRRVLWRTSIALVVIVVTLAGCTPRGRRGGPDPTATGTASLKIVRTLDRLVVQSFTLQPSGSGLRDLGAAADLAEDPSAERAALEKNRFVRAYTRLFVRGQYSVGVLAYEFRTAAGATAYMRYTNDDAKRNYDAKFFKVPSIAGARGQSQQNKADRFYLRAVSFPRGGVLYSVVIAGPKFPDVNDVVRLAQTLDRLVASIK